MLQKQFELYLSGIFYGRVYFHEKQLGHEKLDVYSGKLLPKTALSEEDENYYKNLFKFDIKAVAENFEQYETSLRSATSKEITIKDTQEIYSKWTEDRPYTAEIWVQREKKYPLDIWLHNGSIIAFTLTWREGTAVLVEKGYEKFTPCIHWQERNQYKLYNVQPVKSYMVAMRDGVHLATDVLLPSPSNEKPAVILVRTPYGRQDGQESYWRYVQRGYAVVIQDVRGRNDSEGLWEPCANEIEDGDDCLNWIAEQDWNNSKIGTIGGSYLGFVQWAAAASGNPHLKAIVSIVTSGSPFVDIPRRGGALISGMLAWAFAMSKQKFHPELMIRDDWDKVLKIRPLNELAKTALGYDIPFLQEWLNHPAYDKTWARMNWSEKSENIHVPALILSGWYDDNSMGTTEALEIVKKYPQGQCKVILGPWVHSGNAARDIHAVPFGNNALRYDIDTNYLLWLDKYLMDMPNGIEKTAPVEYYSVGQNKWKTASKWPLSAEEGIKRTLYLEKGGLLTFEKPQEESSAGYVYDPENPAPHLIDMSENEIGVPADYSEVEKREDVLVYTTAPFTEDCTITGDMDVTLWASSDARDTDWFVRICDVDESGKSIKMVDGVLCARFREGFDTTVFMEKDEIYPFSIQTTKISNTLLVGHSLRFSITSSAENFTFPNSNTEAGYLSSEKRIANNMIYHGASHASCFVLTLEL